VAALAARLRADGLAPTAIWHSPLRRARETAALLAQHTQPAGQPILLIGKSHLQPEDDPAKIVRLLYEMPPRANLAIVGHEPHLSALATLLVTGRAEPMKFAFETAGLLTLAPAEGKHETNGLPRWEPREQSAPA
jgi:phosphohistidine phosphatase